MTPSLTGRRRLAAVALVPLAAVLFAACGGSEDASTTTQDASPAAAGSSADNGSAAASGPSAADGSPAATGAPAAEGAAQSGGTLRFAVGSDAGCLDPQQVASNDSIYSVRQLVDSLTDQDPETGEIVPWLAEKWAINADSTEYTFTLRDGAIFSDGEPVDAAAVKANFDRALELGTRGSLPKSYLANYEATTVVDPLTFTVSFTSPNAQFLQGTTTHSLGLLSPASVAQTDDERCAAPIGSGPFTVESYTKDDTLVLAKRADYNWGSSLWQHEGAAYLDTLEFSIVPESGIRSGSLIAGEVDAIGVIAAQDEQQLVAAGVQLPSRVNPGLPIGIGFNNGNGPTADVAVREAFSLATNSEEVAAAVYTSNTPVADSQLSSTTPGYESQAALLGYDPDKARSVLDAAGWVAGADGIREKDGQRLTVPVVYFTNYAPSKPSLELIQQQVAEVGIEVELQERPIADATTVLESGEFGGVFSGLTRADPDILRTSFSTELANSYRLPASELDALLNAQGGNPDQTARFAEVSQIQQLLTEQYVRLPIVAQVTTLGIGADVQGWTFDASSRIHLFDTWKQQS